MKNLPIEILDAVDHTLAKPTRIHPLDTANGRPFWIKREDELSSGISGSKLRKYASLIPYLKKKGVEHVAMIGGPNSNNLVGLAQLLRENDISQTAFVREAADAQLRGNALLLDMLLNEDEIRFITRGQWQAVETTARTYLDNLPIQKTHLLCEGCFGIEGLPGAMTLAADILRNEEESNLYFERIYIDCGTGLSALGLILGLACLSSSARPKREIVVTLIAESEEGFLQKLKKLTPSLAQEYGLELNIRDHIRFIKPQLSPKFGSINKSLFEECRKIAQNTGLIMDPTYSVKHYHAATNDLSLNSIKKPSLFIFNGAALGVMGFQDKLSP